jgi:class 3 adenylate cyclase
LNVFRGREISTTGDGILAVFDSATRAVQAAVAMSRSARAMGLSIRVGVHTGEIAFVGSDVRGVAVHAAARVMSLAGADDVIVSSTTRDLLEGSDVALEDAGTHDLKGLTGARHVFRVVARAGEGRQITAGRGRSVARPAQIAPVGGEAAVQLVQVGVR